MKNIKKEKKNRNKTTTFQTRFLLNWLTFSPLSKGLYLLGRSKSQILAPCVSDFTSKVNCCGFRGAVMKSTVG